MLYFDNHKITHSSQFQGLCSMQRIKYLPYFASKKTQKNFELRTTSYLLLQMPWSLSTYLAGIFHWAKTTYEIVLCDFDNILFTWMNIGNLFLKYNELQLFPGIWWNPEGIVHSIVSHQKAPDQEILFSLRSDFQLQPQPDLHPEHL